MRSLPIASALAAVLLASALPACLDAPEHVYGYDLLEHRLSLYSLDMGVHPSTTVLNDPNNPFRYDGVGAETKWTLLNYATNAAAFYAWATLLATQPNGEHQYYTALTLQRVHDHDEVTSVEKPYVREMAIAGFAAVLTDFPESVSFDPSGAFGFRLAPLAYQGILDLGGTPPPGWIVVVVEGGGTTVIQVPDESQDAPDPAETPAETEN